jgi:hypothetical protein
MGRGGARPNAGRKIKGEIPCKDKTAVSVLLEPQIIQAIDATGMSRNQCIGMIVKDFFKDKI